MFSIQGIETIEELHQSDSSIVYLGRDTTTQQKVAVKILKDEFPSLQNIAKFNEEYEITNRFDIQGIRKVLAKKKVQNRHTLILEYVEGDTIRKLIDSKKITLDTFFDIAIKVSEIIASIHSKDIIHKDINPKNIIVLSDGHIKVIDFGIASMIRREFSAMKSPDVLEGTLAYISPEQTGRMNRSIDSRSDLYSLGITLYEMITGKLPFEATDAMEIVHSHIARIPLAPAEVNPDIPPVVSDIIMKLLAKNAEDRYQSALGLRADLEKCAGLAASGTLKNARFSLAEKDALDIFRIPEKLYGRESERDKLLEAFAGINKRSILMLVAGYSGIGKTALINEIHKPITEKKGYFISGKFEQFQRDIPYSAIIQALNDFVNQILAEPAEHIANWKDKILNSVGANGQVLIDVIPNLELIIGKQPELPQLGPSETQNRFNVVFEVFIRDISKREHPVVMFIDDWQWADASSLNILKLMMSDMQNTDLLVLGAYRNNEVDSSHPFALMLEAIKKVGADVREIMLTPLKEQHINAMLADTLHLEEAQTKPLAELIHNKTGGNPFFVNQFLQTLYKDNHISFDYTAQRWVWNSVSIEHLGITNNVVELMTSKIKKLGPATQYVLQLAACIGNQFSLEVLAFVNHKSPQDTLQELWEAIEEGLVVPMSNLYSVSDESVIDAKINFKFLHDRVEQAAYDMVDKEKQKLIRLQIARMIRDNSSPKQIEENIFDIVNYFNSGKEFIYDESEKLQVAELNLRVVKKAKQSTAYQASIQYGEVAREMLGANAWQQHYRMTFELYKELGDCLFQIGQFDASENALLEAINNADSKFEKAEIYLIRIAQLAGQGKFPAAVETTIEALSLFGIEFPPLAESQKVDGPERNNATEEQAAAAGAEIGRYLQNMTGRDIASLANLPEIRDEEKRVCMQLIGVAMDTVIIAYPLQYFGLFCAKMVNISIEYGLSPDSPLAFVWWAVIQSSGFKNLQGAFSFAQLALDLNENQFRNRNITSKVYVIYAYMSTLTYHIQTGIDYHKKAAAAGREFGDFVYGGYGASIGTRFAISLNIKNAMEDINKALEFFVKVNNVPMQLFTRLNQSFARNMQGSTYGRETFDNPDFSEKQYQDAFEKAAPLLYCLYVRYKLQSQTLYGFYHEAMRWVNERALWLTMLEGLDPTFKAEYHLYAGLTVAALFEEASEEDKPSYMEILDECIAGLKYLADKNPINFNAPCLILQAEKARLTKEIFEARKLFKKAIEATVQDPEPFYQYEGVAREGFLKLYLFDDFRDEATLHLARAHYAFRMWGAPGKARQLEEKYHELFVLSARTLYGGKGNVDATMSDSTTLGTYTTRSTNNTSTTRTAGLDFQTIMKASQAISGEIKLDRLLTRMMRILIENAGAQRGLIIQNQADKLLIAAEGKAGDENIEVLKEIKSGESVNLPLSLVHYVERTKETLVLDDASRDKRFGNDKYIQQSAIKSVLCAPVIHQGSVRAVIYLENNLASGVFTPERTNVLNMLSGQISISIENAVLYDSLEQKVAERTAQLAEKNEELNEKNLRITDSIRYAKRIQQAILPTHKELTEVFTDYFALYRPKDIVSGDFYWCKNVEGRIFVAAVDCTGHGVPGAFMSMIGNTLLDEIVNGKKAKKPAEVLELLDVMIKAGLRQQETENTDGMDVCLCMVEDIDDQLRKVTFTGAKRSLYYYKDGQLSQLDADRRSIGGVFSNSHRPFTNQEVTLRRGDILYLTTDGYADQANPDRKGFGTRQLKELFAANTQLSMEKQKEVYEQTLDSHQQSAAQRDDITVIGIKL